MVFLIVDEAVKISMQLCRANARANMMEGQTRARSRCGRHQLNIGRVQDNDFHHVGPLLLGGDVCSARKLTSCLDRRLSIHSK